MTREEAKKLVYDHPDAAVDLIVQSNEAVEILKSRVAELERKIALLTRDSSNSSKPPSSDGPGKRPRIQRPKKSRKRNPGGQPGHKGTRRELVPIEEVDHVEEVLPETCGSCHRLFDPESSRVLGNYFRCQVIDIPKIKPLVPEYTLRCVARLQTRIRGQAYPREKIGSYPGSHEQLSPDLRVELRPWYGKNCPRSARPSKSPFHLP